MSEIPFHTTGLGRAFYERHVPRLVTAVEQLANAAERIAAALEASRKPGAASPHPLPIDADAAGRTR